MKMSYEKQIALTTNHVSTETSFIRITLFDSLCNESLFLLQTYLFWQWQRTNQTEGHIESSIQMKEFIMQLTLKRSEFMEKKTTCELNDFEIVYFSHNKPQCVIFFLLWNQFGGMIFTRSYIKDFIHAV